MPTIDLAIIPNTVWGEERHNLPGIKQPARWNFLHHSVTAVDLNNNQVWADDLARLDDIADSRGFTTISYSFAADTSGQVWAARGWGRTQAATRGYNSTSHSIVAIGNYDTTRPSAELVEAIAKWHAYSIANGHTTNGDLRAHRSVSSTACPGRYLVAALPEINTRAQQLLGNEPMPTDNTARITRIQKALIAAGYKLPKFGADGDLGDETEQAITTALADLAKLGDTNRKTAETLAATRKRLTACEATTAAAAEATKRYNAARAALTDLLKPLT